MPSRKPFLPPRLNPVVLGCAKAALPMMFHLWAGGIDIEISEEDLKRLRSLKGKRLLLLPNHPTHFDPMVLIEVSRRIDEDFLFVAAREVFDWEGGLRGWLFQRCGVYSLIRGAVDRESFTMTQQILSEGEHPLVIFIEGEVSLNNAAVLPFEPGVISLAMRVQEKLSATPENPPLHVAPIAMRTFYKAGVEVALTKALARLEAAVGIGSKDGEESIAFAGWEAMRTRVDAVGKALLTSVESTYLLQTQATDSLDERMKRLKDRMLAKIEGFLDITPVSDASVLDRIRSVKNRMDKIVHTYGEGATHASAYERRLLERRRQTFDEFYTDLSRLINMLTLRGDYLDHAPPERFAEVIIRLEQEILGKPNLSYPRVVQVRLGEVEDMRAHLPEFRADKRHFCAQYAVGLEKQMVQLLQGARGNMDAKTPRPVR